MDTATDIAARLERAVAGLEAAVAAADASVAVPETPGWCVADVLAHLAIESDRYARELEGGAEWSASPADIAETNRRALQDFTERDVHELHALIRRNVRRYVACLQSCDLDEPIHGFDAAIVLAPRHGAGSLVGELTVHGYDIRQAVGRPAAIRRDDAAFIIDGIWHVSPAFVDPERAANFSGTFEVRLRGHQTLSLRIDRGHATVDTPVPTPDAIVSADPVGLLLLLYGRSTLLRAMLRFHAVTWGRRPYRALQLPRLIMSP